MKELERLRKQVESRYPKKQKREYTSFRFMFLVLIMASAVYLVKSTTFGAKTSRALSAAIDDGGVVDLREIAPFPWESLYVFAPGTSGEDIDQALGFTWTVQGPKRTLEKSDDHHLLLFVSKGAVQRYAKISKSVVSDFCPEARGRRVPAEFAQFAVEASERLCFR